MTSVCVAVCTQPKKPKHASELVSPRAGKETAASSCIAWSDKTTTQSVWATSTLVQLPLGSAADGKSYVIMMQHKIMMFAVRGSVAHCSGSTCCEEHGKKLYLRGRLGALGCAPAPAPSPAPAGRLNIFSTLWCRAELNAGFNCCVQRMNVVRLLSSFNWLAPTYLQPSATMAH